MERMETLIGGAPLGERSSAGGVRAGGGLAGERLEPLTPQEINDVSREISGVQDSVIPQDFPTPERLYEENVAPVEPPPTVQPDGTKRPTERATVEILNYAEKFMGAVRLVEDEWKKRRPARNYALGVIPLNTRKWREFYNAIRDLWIPVLVVALGRPGGPIQNSWSEFREGGTQRYQVNSQTVDYSQILLDPTKNNGGGRIWELISVNSGGRDLDNRDSWPKESDLWYVARDMSEFWKGIGDPNVREDLISRLPQSLARSALEQLPNRTMTDEEIKAFLEGKGINSKNAELLRQITREFRSGDGEVTRAFNEVKK